MATVDVRNVPTVVEIGPDAIVAEFTETDVTAQVMVGPTVVEFSWGELIPEPGLSGGGVFQGRVYIRPDIPTLPLHNEPIDPNADMIMVWDASRDEHVKRLAALGGGGGGGVEFATREETDAGILLDKALNPDVGAYAYDRFRWPGQHSAGKGTASVVLTPVSGVITIDQSLSNVFETTLSQNVVFANPINPIGGQTVNILVRQNLTGGFTGTFGSAWTFTNKSTPAFTTTPGAVDLLSCQWDQSAGKMRATLLPNFGSGFTSPTSPGDFTFTNVGTGEGVFKEVVGNDARFRTLIGTGDISVTTEGDVISIAYTTPAALIPYFQTLPDVDLTGWAGTQFLRWDGEKVVTSEVAIPDTSSQSYLTLNDETASLPNALRLIPGDNMSFDYSVPGQITMSSLGLESAFLNNDGCEVTRNTDLSVTGYGAISFITEVRDDSGYWDPGAPDRFTIPQDGWYVVTGYIQWSATSASHGLMIYKNGTALANEIASNYTSAVGTNIRNEASFIGYLQTGDQIIFRGYTSGTQTIAGTTSPMRAGIHRLGVGPPGPVGPIGPSGPAEDDGTFLRRLVDDTALGNYTFEHLTPRLIFKELDAPTNEKRWDIQIANSIYKLRSIGDVDGASSVTGAYLTNPRAESMTGWTTLSGNPGVVINRCPPVLAGTGTNGFWGGTSSTSSMKQSFSLASFPEIDLALIDAGSLNTTMHWWGGSWIQSPHDKPRILLRFKNAALTEIGTFDTGYRNVSTGGSFGSYYWTEFNDVITLPALTRHIDVELYFQRNVGTNNDATVTDISFIFSGTTVGEDTVYQVTRDSYRALNLDIQTDTLTHNGNLLSELGHEHPQFGKTYGAIWRTSDGSALSPGNCQVVYVSVPAACSIYEMILLTEGGTGSCIVDVWKAPFVDYPPTIADAITGVTVPTIISNSKARDEELNGWNRDIAAGDILAFKVDSTSIFSTIQIQLKVL